jgi:signal transduction histidine kinase/DNA-binding response OmpR family regulator
MSGFRIPVLWLLAAALRAQAPPAAIDAGQPLLRYYPPSEYRAGTQIWTVASDKRGVMYFGHNLGILEYDGVNWRKLYTTGSSVRALAVSPDGRIYCGGIGDFGYLEADSEGQMQYHSLRAAIPEEHREFSDIWQIALSPTGVFFQSYQRLFRWDGKRLQAWRARQRFEGVSYTQGKVLTSDSATGLHEVTGDELRPLPGGEAAKGLIRLFFHRYDDTRMLVTARESLLHLYDGNKLTPFPTEIDAILKQSTVYTSTALPGDRYVINTLRGGMFLLDHAGRLLRHVGPENGLPVGQTYWSHLDGQGNLWLGLARGAARMALDSTLSQFPTPAGVTVSDLAFFEGTQYLAAGEGVYRLAAPHAKVAAASHVRLSGPVVQYFFFLKYQPPAGPPRLLAAGNPGVTEIVGDRVVPTIPVGPGNVRSAYTILPSRKVPGRVFSAGMTGLHSQRLAGNQWVDEGRLPGIADTLRWMVEDAEGVLWVSSQTNGLLRVRVPAEGASKATFDRWGTAQGLPPGGIRVNAIGEDIFATAASDPQGGTSIYCLDSKAQRFVLDTRFQIPDVIPSGFQDPVTLRELANGDVWVGIDRNYALFRKEAGNRYRMERDAFRQFRLLTGDTVSPVLDPDGFLWLAGDGHLLRVDLARLRPNTAPYETLIRRISSGSGQLVYGGAAGSGFRAPELPSDHRALRFEFGATSFENEAETQFQFRLDGADTDWSGFSLRREVSYNNLEPGSYVFRLQSRDGGGRKGKEAAFPFRILPPWYRTWWAYGSYFVLFGLVVAGSRYTLLEREREKSRRRTQQLEAQARELEATVSARTEEIRAQGAEIAKQRETVERLSDIGREITASLDLETILFKLYERVNQLMDAAIFGVGLHQPGKQQIEYTLAIENGKRYAPYTRDTRDKNQFPVWCIDHRKPLRLNDVSAEYGKYIQNYQHAGGLLEDGTRAAAPQSMLYVPLIAQDRVLGVLSVQSFQKNAYSEYHLKLLESLAAYTTIALDNASAYRMIQQREQDLSARAFELATINRISQAMSSQLEMDQLIQIVGDQVRDVFKASQVEVALRESPTQRLAFRYAHGPGASQGGDRNEGIAEVLRSGRAMRREPAYLAAPVPAGGQTAGVITVQGTAPFTEADQRLLSTIASAFGVSVHNVRLFEETRQARAAAEEADAAKSSFLSTVSHELRTPLTSVLGFAKIIKRRLEERLFPLVPETDKRIASTKKQVMENLDVVVSEGERLTKLINDVLDLAKIEAGKLTWHMEPLHLNDIIDRAAAATASLFESKKLAFVREVEQGLPEVTGDRDRLIQVVINLFSNAIKFTKEGTLTCRATLRDGELLVSVTDTGIGIAPADQPKVFEKFKQVGDTLTDKPTGTGLGLPICKEIIEHHGGRIWVESELGKGSTFFFTLPALGAEQREAPLPLATLIRRLREQVALQQPNGKSILVVDDDASIRSLLKQEFSEAGFGVRLAENGRRALELVREQVPDLIILDVMMPEMNGFDVAAVVKNDPATMHIPIIILSIVEDKERGFRLGVDRYLTKPIDTPALFREVGTLLDQGKSHKKVMVVDEDASTVRTLAEALQASGYHVVESNGNEIIPKAMSSRPDVILLNSAFTEQTVHALRFEKGLEHVVFLIYQSPA